MGNETVRVRFAPSPTGPLHIGGVRTALFNYLFAKQQGGDFLLRIEDTDQTRYIPGAEDYITEALAWLGLNYDEGVGVGGHYGPYRQSERKLLYQQFAEQLVASGWAYYAFDTPEELETMRERLTAKGVPTPQYDSRSRLEMKNSLSLPDENVKQRLDSGEAFVIRMKIPDDEDIIINDLIRGEVKVNSSRLDDKVLFKSDGMPTYHLANVVDDHLMRITHVIRGEEWLPSTPLHLLLYRALDWEASMPEFAHLPLIMKPDGKGKLSKRDGDRLGFPVFPLHWRHPQTGEEANGYRESGYLPEAVINILAFLGWNPGTTQELFSKDELIQAFSFEKVGKAGAKFDPDKARWYNAQYLRQKDDTELAEMFQCVLQGKDLSFTDDYVAKVCAVMKERLTFIADLWDQGHFFFQAPLSYDAKVVKKRWKESTPNLMKALTEIIELTQPFDSKTLEDRLKQYIEEQGLGFGAVMNPLRLCLTGASIGPHLFDIMAIIGQQETIRRIKQAIETIKR